MVGPGVSLSSAARKISFCTLSQAALPNCSAYDTENSPSDINVFSIYDYNLSEILNIIVLYVF